MCTFAAKSAKLIVSTESVQKNRCRWEHFMRHVRAPESPLLSNKEKKALNYDAVFDINPIFAMIDETVHLNMGRTSTIWTCLSIFTVIYKKNTYLRALPLSQGLLNDVHCSRGGFTFTRSCIELHRIVITALHDPADEGIRADRRNQTFRRSCPIVCYANCTIERAHEPMNCTIRMLDWSLQMIIIEHSWNGHRFPCWFIPGGRLPFITMSQGWGTLGLPPDDTRTSILQHPSTTKRNVSCMRKNSKLPLPGTRNWNMIRLCKQLQLYVTLCLVEINLPYFCLHFS